METLNNYPLVCLRRNNTSFKAEKKRLNKRLRNPKLLRSQIYGDQNVFQSNVNMYRGKRAQNILWDKKYDYQRNINQLTEHNSALRARIWNVEKENRRMERQIKSWNLGQCSLNPTTKKPYIDMATVQKVINDQEYNIVSLKIAIVELQKELASKQEEQKEVIHRNSQWRQITQLLNHDITNKKLQLCASLIKNNNKQVQKNNEGSAQSTKNQANGLSKEELADQVLLISQQIQLIAKNMEIKKRTKAGLSAQLNNLTSECQNQKTTTLDQLQGIHIQIRSMRAQENLGLSLQKESCQNAKRQTLEYECQMQTKMGDFIATKIALQKEIDQLKKEMYLLEQ